MMMIGSRLRIQRSRETCRLAGVWRRLRPAIRSIFVPVLGLLMFGVGAIVFPAVAAAATQGDAYATEGANACTWEIGTSAIENQLTFNATAGTYTLTSFENKLTSSATQYVAASNPSPEFRFKWDGNVLTGATPGWTCVSGSVSTVQEGGQPALELHVAVAQSGVQVTSYYVIYPDDSLIRQWTEYTNTSTSSHELTDPSFLADNLMSSQIQAGTVNFNYMTGAQATAGSWTLQTGAETPTYARTFDSYDAFGCTNATAESSGCPQTSWSETSSAYIPWFSMWDTADNDGVYMGFDYNGRWAAPIGQQNGEAGSLALDIPNYDSTVAAGQTVTSPKSFVGTYVNNSDDMTNRLLDWQYRYMWDYTRPAYFAKIRMLGTWSNGATCFSGGTPDYSGTLQKVFGLIDHMSYIGADIYHRDCGWWNTPGDWLGPDWKITGNYLGNYGMQQLIYYWAYDANTNSAVYQAHPDWFTTASPCGYAQQLIDLTNTAAFNWVLNLLVNNATKWGDYEWRNDSCPVGATSGAQQLAQSQAYQTLKQDFLDARPGSAIQTVDSGGNEVNYEGMRMASSSSITDLSGVPEQHDASMIFPTDKMSGIPDDWNPANCNASWNILLQFNPDFTGDTNDAQALECMRKLVDTYRYLVQEGVAGRWVWQYHPDASDSDDSWFERLSQDDERGLVIYQGSGSSTSVTMYPRGLISTHTYNVSFQFETTTYNETGAELMSDGITMPSLAAGELVYLGLPEHPGSGTDTTAPTPPTNVQAAGATNMGYRGVAVTWTPGTDNNWISYYTILRNGSPIGKVSQGDYFFDHTAGASASATYAVETVDGDGNVSTAASAPSTTDLSTVAADDALGNGITYTGLWQHQTGLTNLFDGTLSTSAGSCNTACQGFSNVQGANNWKYQDEFSGTWQNMATYSSSGYMGMAQWTDTSPVQGGFVWPTAEHPPPVNTDAAARVWTAPQTGTIDIQSHAVKLVSGGSVKVEITDNGSVIAGPDTIAGTDTTTGVELDVNSLAVTAGDVIRFQISSIGSYAYDATTWNPTITYQPVAPETGSGGFSNVQGANNWKYQDEFSGTWQNMATYSSSGYMGMAQWTDTSPVQGGYVWPTAEHPPPVNTDAAARAWTAPVTGTIYIQSRAVKLVSGGSVKVEITDNGSVIAGPDTIQGSDMINGVELDVNALPVTAGDVIRFQISSIGSYASDATTWNPVISYSPITSPETASYTFTGSQITWYAALGPNEGRAQVSIDGTPQTTIDLYAPDPNNDSVPVYTRTFATVGTHTIKITATQTANPMSSGTAISLDGFQASTSSPTVVANNAAGIDYVGSGWAEQTAPQASGGTVMASSEAGDSATYSFTGDEATLVGRLCSACGEADIYVDGQYATRIDGYGYRGASVWQAGVFEHSWSTPGAHTIKVVVLGSSNIDSTGDEFDLDSIQTRDG